MGTSRRRFSREFKLEAVRMVAGGRHSLAQVARELDLRPEMLRRWKRQVEEDGEQAFPGHGRLKADDEQVAQGTAKWGADPGDAGSGTRGASAAAGAAPPLGPASVRISCRQIL